MKKLILLTILILTSISCERLEIDSEVSALFKNNLEYVDYQDDWYVFIYDDKIEKLLRDPIITCQGPPSICYGEGWTDYVYTHIRVRIEGKRYILLKVYHNYTCVDC